MFLQSSVLISMMLVTLYPALRRLLVTAVPEIKYYMILVQIPILPIPGYYFWQVLFDCDDNNWDILLPTCPIPITPILLSLAEVDRHLPEGRRRREDLTLSSWRPIIVGDWVVLRESVYIRNEWRVVLVPSPVTKSVLAEIYVNK